MKHSCKYNINETQLQEEACKCFTFCAYIPIIDDVWQIAVIKNDNHMKQKYLNQTANWQNLSKWYWTFEGMALKQC